MQKGIRVVTSERERNINVGPGESTTFKKTSRCVLASQEWEGRGPCPTDGRTYERRRRPFKTARSKGRSGKRNSTAKKQHKSTRGNLKTSLKYPIEGSANHPRANRLP